LSSLKYSGTSLPECDLISCGSLLAYSSAHIKDQLIHQSKQGKSMTYGVKGCSHLSNETLKFSLFRRMMCA